MNTKPVTHPKSITWGATSLDGVKAVSIRQQGEVIADSSDGDKHPSVVALAGIGSEVIVSCDNIASISAVNIGAEAELRFTFEGARPGDAPITFTAPAAMLVDKRIEGKHGEIAGGFLKFVLRSPDGVTAPISAS
jgi:hypothetical protein